MKVALILMTILGCDDSGAQCTAVETLPQRYTSVASCDTASQTVLDGYKDIDYPMVVAVCQSPDAGDLALSTGQEPAAQPKPEGLAAMAQSAVDLVTDSLPTMDGLKTIVETPVHIVTDTYSWVARKIGDD